MRKSTLPPVLTGDAGVRDAVTPAGSPDTVTSTKVPKELGRFGRLMVATLCESVTPTERLGGVFATTLSPKSGTFQSIAKTIVTMAVVETLSQSPCAKVVKLTFAPGLTSRPLKP